MEEEIWKPIKDYEGLYEVSNLGRVKSLNYRKTGKEKILKNIECNNGYLKVGLIKFGKCKMCSIHRLVAEAFIPNPEDKPCIDHINTIKNDNRVENLRWVTHKENNNNPLTKKKYSENHREQAGENNPMYGRTGENNPMYGKHHSEETRKKMSESHMGENHHMYGKHHSEETKNKMSESHKGKINNKPRRIYCIELDKIYNSIREAEKELNISRTNIIKACKDINKSAGKHPVTKEKLHWRYL